jgi:two-component system nitrogen regulation response regulator NtrX
LRLKVLIADDEKDVADSYSDILQKRGHRTVVTYNGDDCITEYLAALERNEGLPYDVVIIDYSMPGMSGVKLAKRILGMNPNQQIVFVSGYGTEFIASLGGFRNVDFLTKPAIPNALIRLVER